LTNRTVLLDEPEVSLEGRKLTVAGSSFTLGEVRSAEVRRVPKAATGPILMITVGVIALISAAGESGVTAGVVGGGLLLAAAAWWSQKKPSFQVSLGTDTGEAVPFESADEATASRVLAAIVEAQAAPEDG